LLELFQKGIYNELTCNQDGSNAIRKKEEL
jgi:hypothetical protein